MKCADHCLLGSRICQKSESLGYYQIINELKASNEKEAFFSRDPTIFSIFRLIDQAG